MLKRLLKLDLGNRKINISLLSATFSELLIELLDERLLIQKEPDQLTRSNWISLFTEFEPEDELFKKFSSFRTTESEPLRKPISRWFLRN